MAEHPTRKLAVILHADVVSSTRLVQRNETLAHERIQDAFRRFSSTIEAYNGVTHELRGDALVAEFARASDAVSAGLAFQIENTESNTRLEDDLRPRLRIGVSLGEEVIADGTVTGAGVVLAQRVEQFAEPGGVCITAAIHEAVPQHMPFEYSDLGKREVKGFEEPVQVYGASVGAGKQIPPPEASKSVAVSLHRLKRSWAVSAIALLILIVGGLVWWQPWLQRVEAASIERMAFPLPDKPSIAVLPFDNLSGDAEQDYFVDGLTEDIITELSRFSELFVISRSSTFTYKDKAVKIGQVAEELGVRYVVGGSIRRTATELLITVQLIDATSGVQMWSERYERPLTEFRGLQADVLNKIVSTVTDRLENIGRRIASRKHTENLSAYEHVLQGYDLVQDNVRESNEQARLHFERAIELDNQYASAYAGLGWSHSIDYLYGWSEDGEKSRTRAREAGFKAIDLDDGNSHARSTVGWTLIYEGKVDEGVTEIERAIALNPNDAAILANGGYALIYHGEFEKAVDRLQRAMRLNPFHPDYYHDALGWAYYFLNQHEAALRATKRIAKPSAGQHRLLAAIYARLGQMDKARKHARQVLEAEPGFEVGIFAKTMPFKDPIVLERYLEGLRLAGLP